MRDLIERGVVASVHDASDGGLLVAIAEMALSGGYGAHVGGGPLLKDERFSETAHLFGEDQGNYVVAVPPENLEQFLSICKEYSVAGWSVGETTSSALGLQILQNVEPGISLTDLRAAHEGFFPTLMGADAALA